MDSKEIFVVHIFETTKELEVENTMPTYIENETTILHIKCFKKLFSFDKFS